MSGSSRLKDYPSQPALRVLANAFYGLPLTSGFKHRGGYNYCISACRFHGYITEFDEITDIGINALCKKAQLHARRHLERSPQET